MNKIDKCKAAQDYHTHGCNCAQSILAAFQEEMGLTEDQCMALAGGMGGGMRCGSICGAISGGILVLGMLFPARPNEGPDAKRRITRQIQEYIRRFRELLNDSKWLRGTELPLRERQSPHLTVRRSVRRGGRAALPLRVVICAAMRRTPLSLPLPIPPAAPAAFADCGAPDGIPAPVIPVISGLSAPASVL